MQIVYVFFVCKETRQGQQIHIKKGPLRYNKKIRNPNKSVIRDSLTVYTYYMNTFAKERMTFGHLVKEGEAKKR